MHKNELILIGICGGSGSGKTTFAEKVLAQISNIPSSIIHMDSYYLPIIPSEIYGEDQKPNYDHPEAFDWTLLKHHLLSLKLGETISSPVYDFTTNQRSQEVVMVIPPKVILLEGIFTLYDSEIRNLLDIKCFLQVDSDIRFTRRLHRDVDERGRSLESVISQYYSTVRPMYQKFLDPQRQFADFIVGEETDIASNILAARIKELASPGFTFDSYQLN